MKYFNTPRTGKYDIPTSLENFIACSRQLAAFRVTPEWRACCREQGEVGGEMWEEDLGASS